MNQKSPFIEVNPNLSPEQKIAIAKRGGQLTGSEKHPEERLYVAVLKYTVENFTVESLGELSNYEEINERISTRLLADSAITRIGRRALLDSILELLRFETYVDTIPIDPKKSMVFVEGVDLSKYVSLYRFLGLCANEYKDVKEEIEEYLAGTDNTEESAEETYNTANTNDTAGSHQATGMGNFGGTILNT